MEAVDQFSAGFGWIADEFLQRCSHALIAEGHVWLIDPVDADGVDERVHAAGAPAGVLQLLDRHSRDCETLASRLGVPHHVVPEGVVGPFEFLTIRMTRSWKEVVLWWPDERVLVCADALGTARYFRAGGERLGVHPLLRLRPPRRLGALQPDVILCGHGEGLFEDAAAALREALSTSRRRIPLQTASATRAWWARRGG